MQRRRALLTLAPRGLTRHHNLRKVPTTPALWRAKTYLSRSGATTMTKGGVWLLLCLALSGSVLTACDEDSDKGSDKQSSTKDDAGDGDTDKSDAGKPSSDKSDAGKGSSTSSVSA